VRVGLLRRRSSRGAILYHQQRKSPIARVATPFADAHAAQAARMSPPVASDLERRPGGSPPHTRAELRLALQDAERLMRRLDTLTLAQEAAHVRWRWRCLDGPPGGGRAT
jgi:hypothetical protein